MLYVSPRWRERIRPIAPSYISFEDTTRGLESPYKPDARRYDTPSFSREAAALSLGALEVLERHGFDEVLAHGRAQAAALARRLEEAGHTVAPRGDSTLVAWEDADPEATRDRLRGRGRRRPQPPRPPAAARLRRRLERRRATSSACSPGSRPTPAPGAASAPPSAPPG